MLIILLTTLWQSAVLAAIVSLLIFVLGDRLRPNWRYWLWCVVLLRLAIPVLPTSPLGFWGETAKTVMKNTVIPQSVVSQPLETAPPVFAPPPQSETPVVNPVVVESPVVSAKPVAVKPVAWTEIAKNALVIAWGLGMCGFLVRFLIGEIRLARKSRSWRPVEDSRLLALLDSCRTELGMRRHVRLVFAPGKIGAASCGFYAGTVLLTEESVKIATESQLRLILLHELAHLKRFDPPMQRFALLVRAVQWFNPVAWFAYDRIQRERELACDAAVLERSGPQRKKEYGYVLLTFTELFSAAERLPGLVGLFQKHSVERRIEMVARFKKSRWYHVVLGAILVVAVAAFGLTKAQTKTENEKTGPVQNETFADGLLIRGVVVDENDQPVSGATVWTNSEAVPETVSDSQGRFQLPGYFLYHHIQYLAYIPGTDRIGYVQLPQIEENSKELPEIKIRLGKGRRFFGKVTDESGNPVAGAYVGASSQSMTIDPVLTDSRGNFEFFYYQTVTFDVFAIKPTVGFDYLKVEDERDRDTIQQNIGPLTLRLTKTDPLSVHVENESGVPIEGIQVEPWLISISGKKYRSGLWSTNTAMNTVSKTAQKLKLFFATTDAQGNAVIDWLPKEIRGETEIIVREKKLNRENLYGTERVLWKPGTGHISVQLPELVPIRGSVRLPDGAPVPFASLSYQYERRNGWEYADQNGGFFFTLNPHETMAICVESKLGAASTAFNIDAGDGKNPPKVDFVLEKGIKIYGRTLAGLNGDTPFSAVVNISEYNPDSKAEHHKQITHAARADKNGNYEIQLMPGKYKASVYPPVRYSPQRVGEIVQEFELTTETEKKTDFVFSVEIPGAKNAATAPKMIPLLKQDVLIYEDGKWTNKATGQEYPLGTTLLNVDGGVSRLEKGELVLVSGNGVSGGGFVNNTLELSGGGRAILVGSKPIPLTEQDVLIFDNGKWTNKTTGEEYPLKTLLRTTQGSELGLLDGKVERYSEHGVSGGTGPGCYIELTEGGDKITVTPLGGAVHRVMEAVGNLGGEE